MKIWSYSVKGSKSVNEDYLLHKDLGDGKFICLIADGMGGYSKGDVAARIVAENILALVSSQKHVDQSLLQIGINKANLALRQISERTLEKCGATIGGVYIEKQKAIFFWVGDVKLLYFRGNDLLFESTSHSLIKELQNRGILITSNSVQSHRHIVTRSIQGDIVNPKADFYEIEYQNNLDRILICSDGYSHNDLIAKCRTILSKELVQSILAMSNHGDDSSYIFLEFNV